MEIHGIPAACQRAPMMLTIVKSIHELSRTGQGLLLLVLAVSLAGWCLTQCAKWTRVGLHLNIVERNMVT